jgi:hypothetical protein
MYHKSRSPSIFTLTEGIGMQGLNVGALALGVFLGSSASAGTWFEMGAGNTLATAERTVGTGSLDTIFGNLPTGSSVDLYLVRIIDPLSFSAATVDLPGLTVSDPQLFLFNYLGKAVYMNDDDESGLNGSQSLLPAAHPFGPKAANQVYHLGIGWFDNEPLSAGGPMFSTANPTGTNGPDFATEEENPLLGWNDNVTVRPDLPTMYQINLTGVGYVPEPGTAFLLALPLAAFFGVRRLRILRS